MCDMMPLFKVHVQANAYNRTYVYTHMPRSLTFAHAHTHAHLVS